MKTNDLAADLLHELFEYRDGKLYWKQPGKSRQMGKPAGSVIGDGYACIRIQYKLYRVHRLVWVMYGNEPVPYIDHINGDKLDNRIENLRAATHSQNCMNRCQRSDNKSGVKGVRLKNGKWYGSIVLNGKTHCAGYFIKKEDAAIAVDKLRKELHGEFARS
jgi:hypothetical protein